MLGSMRARMTLAFACCTVGLMLTTCLILIRYMQRTAERNADTVLQSAIVKLHHELPDNVWNRVELREVETDLSDTHIALVLLNAQGQVVNESQGAASFHKAIPRLRIPGQDHSDWRVRATPLGAYTVLLGLPWASAQHAINNQALLLLTFSVITGGAATLGAWILVGWTLSPISRLSQQARAATGDGGHVQLNAPSQDAEVVELVATLNDLLARQHEATKARGRFYAAASHELRTPLQALSGHLELALQRPRASEEYFAVVQEANAQTQRLTALTRALLQLYQLEGSPVLRQEPVDLSKICEQALQSFTHLIETKRLQIQSEISPHILMASAPTHADILVRNLLENAVRYATPGGIARICLTEDVETIQLELWNSCEIAANWQLERWLEPFYRPDKSRNALTGGNGLGLAICKSIAEANGWELSLRCENRLEASFVVVRVVCKL